MPVQHRPGQKIDHYAILSLLNKGTASSVYLALDRDTGQKVVLKFPHDDVVGGRAIYERYLREVEIGNMLSHPYIIRHLNHTEVRQEKYLVLEYLQGRTLRELIAAHAPSLLPSEEVVALIIQVCEALVYAHKRGVIHQDIKPDNIMLLENGTIKVLDFGIAQIEGEGHVFLPGFSQLVGTPAYMAPERLQGKRGSASTDIYAIGVVLYELFCGHTPFAEPDGFAFVGEHISHDPPDILDFNPSLAPTLATIVMRAIRRDTDKRYKEMEDMLYDLRHEEDMVPIAYIPTTPSFGGRYRQVLALVLVVLFVFLLLILFGLLAQSVHHAAR